jgi:GMP synthase-like glutamine amidotransferase
MSFDERKEPPKRKFCVLTTGEAPDALVPRFGTYDTMCIEWLQESPDEQWDIYKCYNGFFPSEEDIDSYSGFVIPGSKFDAHGTEPWIRRLGELVRSLYERKKKMLGICFGHQLLGLYLGGDSNRAASWEQGVKVSTPNDNFKRYFPPLSHMESFPLVESHQDQVLKLPPDAVLLLSSPKCPNEMFLMPAENPTVLCTQSHPEFSVEFAKELLKLKIDNNILPPEIGLPAYASYQEHAVVNPPEFIQVFKTFIKQP